jgi:hypothetical protein
MAKVKLVFTGSYASHSLPPTIDGPDQDGPNQNEQDCNHSIASHYLHDPIDDGTPTAVEEGEGRRSRKTMLRAEQTPTRRQLDSRSPSAAPQCTVGRLSHN